MADLLEQNPKVAEELADMLSKSAIADLTQAFKDKQTKKKYKVKGKQRTAQIITKAEFLQICEDFNGSSLSDEAVDAIEPSVCLTNAQKENYQVRLLESLFEEVENM